MSFDMVFQMSFVFSSFPTVAAGVHAVYPQGELCYDIVCFTRLPYRHLGEVGDLLDGGAVFVAFKVRHFNVLSINIQVGSEALGSLSILYLILYPDVWRIVSLYLHFWRIVNLLIY